MTYLIKNSTRIIYPIGILVVLGISVYLISNLSSFSDQGALSFGIGMDLTLLSTTLYFFWIRKKDAPKITVIPFFVASTFLAGYLLPESNQGPIPFIIQYVIPLLELGVIGFIGYTVYSLRSSYSNQVGIDFYWKFYYAAVKVLKSERVASVFTTEASMFHYLFNWKKSDNTGYSYYKNSGIVAILITVGLITIAEMFIVHILVERWSVNAAWVLSVISFYTLIQMISLARSIVARRTQITSERCYINYGWLKSVELPLNQIESVSINPSEGTEGIHLSLFQEMEAPNVLITMKEPIKVNGIYGLSKTGDQLLLHLDDPNGFCEELSSSL